MLKLHTLLDSRVNLEDVVKCVISVPLVMTLVPYKDGVQEVCCIPEFVPVAVRGLSAQLSEYRLFEKRK